MTKRNLINLLTLIFFITLSACVPSGGTSSKRKTSGASTNEAEETTESPTFDDDAEIYWYSGSVSYNNSITINEDINTVIYLRGEPIHAFLTSSDEDNDIEYKSLTYCMVASYNSVGAQKNLRARAVPISFMNFATNTREYLLRVDLAEQDASTSTCTGSAYQILTTADAASAVANSDSVFIPSELCPDCNKTISSTNVSLYISNPPLTVNDRIPESQINLGSLILRVTASSTSSSSGSTTGSCTDATCVAKGFDCCLDGQCVNDGELRSTASSDEDFTQALADVNANPNSFINWPNIYYVCGSTPANPDPTPTELPNASATASAYLQTLIEDWKCLEEAKLDEPDYPGKQVCAPGYDNTAFEAVRAKVWAYCGCDADPFPTDPDDSACPDFQLRAYNEDSELLSYSAENYSDSLVYSIKCYTPPVDALPTPFQNLSLPVNIRTVPHRFFRADDGTSVDDLSTLSGQSVLPEGTPFQYIDNSSKTDPDCSGTDGASGASDCSFNMNSILGQMNVTLNQARPAQVVNLDYDQSYIISTLSGYYTPCPTCAADYWFQSFTAFPSSQTGVGLTSISYSTNRSEFGDNNTLGNYEDTIFGRACFLPPTMIPFSHNPSADLRTQRTNRLMTQAALFVNGYQRDWFGFNRGALIGSFDGVKWFAIGKNRRVIASTGKLFLAINAPFGDLADNTDLTVQVLLDQGNSTAPSYDYDPNLEPNDSEQGTGASCQRWHQCETDTDCITRLGWEYMCIDANNFKSKWPKFDVDANELENQEYSAATFTRILQDGMPSGSKKRCVYRGSGSICKGDFTTNLSSARQKMFACAPNFHCESLDNSSFNKQVIRTPNSISNILYGRDADVLGRPEFYIEGQTALPQVVKNAIIASAANFTSETDDIGICRPGRKINQATYINQHKEADSTGRADYISQVGTCDSNATGSTRVMGCPIIQTQDDQTVAKGDLLFTLDSSVQNIQNSCGKESQAVISSALSSLFSSIEGAPLATVASITTETLAADACLRRAGSVCHTDLDCSPNRLHQSTSFNYGQEQFGNTEAEKLYWEENLICGQSAEKPFSTSDNYYDYDMSKNRCCREIGNDFTMFTQGDPTTQNLNSNLNVTAFPYLNPSATGRYSRYAVVGATNSNSATAISNSAPYAQAPIVSQSTGTVPKAYQWKSIHDTGSLTCCGGGWVRKFADGTSVWNDANRLKINPTKFQCLNYSYETPVANITNNNNNFFVHLLNYAKDADRFCLSPMEGGCAEVEFPEPSSSGELILPQLKSSVSAAFDQAVLDTTPAVVPTDSEVTRGMKGLSVNVPYEPIIYENAVDVDTSEDYDYTFFRSQSYNSVSFYMPSYIGYNPSRPVGSVGNNLTAINIKYYDSSGNQLDSVQALTAWAGTCDATGTNPVGMGLPAGQYCIQDNSAGIILHAVAPATTGGGNTWYYAALRLEFNVANGPSFWFNDTTAVPNYQIDTSREGMIRGNEMYYLTKLARLELLGIPQIVYEPVYCNTNRDKLVEGIFTGLETRQDFYDNSHSMAGSNYNVNGRSLLEMYDSRYTTPSSAQTAVHSVDGNSRSDHASFYQSDTDLNERFMFFDESSFDLPQVFSSNEFRCCVQLGEEASEDGKCCSGFRDGDNICKLPSGTDLYVYFNRFVSGEGLGEDQPGGGFTDDDFIPETGEPKVSNTVQNKIQALGEAYCENEEIRGGGAFGYYHPEPNTGGYSHREEYDSDEMVRYSIVDSTSDSYEDGNNESYGISTFLAGYRWNHHIYCK